MNNFFCYIYTKFATAFNVVWVALGFKDEEAKKVFQEGSMVVVGSSFVEISLDTLPNDIVVEFVNEVCGASCDPHQDCVNYKLISDCNCKYSLKISWNVSNVREVYWRTTY